MRELAACCSSFLQFQIVPENSCLHAIRKHHKFPGGLTARVTPVPIPNTEVKPCRADDTALETTRERRSPPGFKFKRPQRPKRSRPFLFLLAKDSRDGLTNAEVPRDDLQNLDDAARGCAGRRCRCADCGNARRHAPAGWQGCSRWQQTQVPQA